MTQNHSSITGPKARPIFSVPKRCEANNAISTTSAMGMMYGLNDAVTALRPSSALSTEIAGVITPSP
jgi:hypothetical protein